MKRECALEATGAREGAALGLAAAALMMGERIESRRGEPGPRVFLWVRAATGVVGTRWTRGIGVGTTA